MTEDQALEMIHELGLPQIFDEIWQNNEPRRFCRQWSKPLAFFGLRPALIERCSRIGSCVPLLESNHDHLLAIEPSTGTYIEFYYDESNVNEIGSSYQQFLTALFVDLGHAGLADLVKEVADRFEYRHLDSFDAFMELDDEASAEEAKQAFVNTIID